MNYCPNIPASSPPNSLYILSILPGVCDIERRQQSQPNKRVPKLPGKGKNSPEQNNGTVAVILIAISAPLGRVFGLGERRLRPASAQSPEEDQQFKPRRSGSLLVFVLILRPSATAFALPRPLRGSPSRRQGRRSRPPQRSQTVHSPRAGQLADARFRRVYVFREEPVVVVVGGWRCLADQELEGT